MNRDTSTGADLRAIVGMRLGQVCSRRGLRVLHHQAVGTKPNGQPNRMPFVLVDNVNDGLRGIVTCKAQNTGGSAEEKVPFDVIRLLEAMKQDSRYRRAWIVLGGNGWNSNLVDFYLDGLGIYIPKMKGNIVILNVDDLLSERFDLT